MTYQSLNPATGKLLKKFDELTDKQLEEEAGHRRECFKTWKQKTYAERAVIVAKAAALMHDRVDEFAHTMTLEMGKRIGEAKGEVEFSANILAYYAKNAERFLANVELIRPIGDGHMESSPIGVIFGVEPWNFPYYQLARVAGPHLMAGNVLMVKHAGCVPQCAIAFEKLWMDAGAPVGLYTNLLISHDQSDRRDRRSPHQRRGVDRQRRGRQEHCGASRDRTSKSSSMELGGSDAFIVLEDADLEQTVKWAVWGRMYNTGQTCCAAKRFIVVEKLADKFLEKFQGGAGGAQSRAIRWTRRPRSDPCPRNRPWSIC